MMMLLKKITIYFSLVVIWLSSCVPVQTTTTSTMTVEVPTKTPIFTLSPTQTETPTLTPIPDMWEIQKCHVAQSIIIDNHTFIWNYKGDIEGRGRVDMILNFTEKNEIRGFAFDFKQLHEYSVSGCVEERAFTLWLQQGNTVEAVIQGEFPATDPRGHFSSSSVLSSDVIAGSLMEKDDFESHPIYLRLSSGTAGTMEHRFQLAGTKDDTVILNASQQFLAAIAKDDHVQVVEMLHFPVEVWFGGQRQQLQNSEKFLTYYNAIFGDGFKERLAITFPNYLMANGGNFVGTISQSVYGGGGIVFNEYGKVIAIYNWEETPTSTPSSPK